MSDPHDYQLIDFGRGRRLERFGRFVLDRPCPAAEGIDRADPKAWRLADARFESRYEVTGKERSGGEFERGEWICRCELPDRWTVAYGRLRFELKRTDFGHLGIFPEQAENWGWLAEQCATRPPGSKSAMPTKVLNLFAYTGGSTLAAAAAGMEVVHIDAAKNVVQWARRNAELSGLGDANVRWIAEDALKFVNRELKRGNRYDAVILDPPSYGHGPRGEVWRLSKHLPRLLDLCGELTAGQPAFVLLSCHTPGYDAAKLKGMVLNSFGSYGELTAQGLYIRAANGRKLPAGEIVKWSNTHRPNKLL